MKITEDGITFHVEGAEDAQITLEVETGAQYDVTVGTEDAGKMKTNLGGKLVLSVELGENKSVPVKVTKCNE